ncbi:MAG: PD40 domain-containing protein [Anaerolineales bacterium]|nr:PD40 domain-containing protein [Anaerolineales bacterium]
MGMMDGGKFRLLILLLALLLLAGCGSDVGLQSTATPTMSPVARTATETLTSKEYLPTYQAKQTEWAAQTAAPTATSPPATPTPQDTPGPSPTPFPHPDIALNFGGDFLWQCDPDTRSQIGVSQYPYDALDVLLAEPETDYIYPVWSPDGNWIAYIKSQPKQVNASLPFDPEMAGTDSIWVMRPDGSDQRQVSQEVTRYDTYWGDSCVIGVSWIEYPPVWSPDGKYIAFVHQDFSGYSYYLVEVSSGETDRILVQEKNEKPIRYLNNQPVWLSKDELVILGNSVQVVQVHSIGDYSTIEIPYPVEFPADAWFGFPVDDYYTIQVKDRKLISSFYVLQGLYPKFLSLWELDIDTQTWANLKDLTTGEWGNPLIGEQVAFSHGLDDNLYFLDPDTWRVRATYSMPESHIVPELYAFFFPDVISYKVAVNIEANIYGDQIKSLSLQGREVQTETLVDLSRMDTDSAPFSLLYYSWRP